MVTLSTKPTTKWLVNSYLEFKQNFLYDISALLHAVAFEQVVEGAGALVYDWVVKDGEIFCKELDNIAMSLAYTFDITWRLMKLWYSFKIYLFVNLPCIEERVLYYGK